MPNGIANAVQAFPDGRPVNSGGRRRAVCHRGHARTPENLYTSGACRECQRERAAFYAAQRRLVLRACAEGTR